MSILQIGAGSVGWVVAHKLAQNNSAVGDIVLASRTRSKCEEILASIERKNSCMDASRSLVAREVDADDVDALRGLIEDVGPDLVVNVGPPTINIPVMEACLQAGVSYLDTSAASDGDDGSLGQHLAEVYDWQWAFRERFAERGITGILSIGFDPGVVNIFSAYAKKHLFDTIDSIDILDVNAGSHGRAFATNFDPVTNLIEIQDDSFFVEDGVMNQAPCHTRMMEVDLPEVGRHKLYSVFHEEVRSLAEFIPARHIEFWMGFSDEYLKYFNVLRDVGMLAMKPVTTTDGISVSPLHVLKAVLPHPNSLAATYTGKTCIGSRISGKSANDPRSVFIYNICDHVRCYAEVESQAIAYTTGVPAVTAALLYLTGKWRIPGIFNVEQLDPDPFLDLLPQIGLSWQVQQLPPSQKLDFIQLGSTTPSRTPEDGFSA